MYSKEGQTDESELFSNGNQFVNADQVWLWIFRDRQPRFQRISEFSGRHHQIEGLEGLPWWSRRQKYSTALFTTLPFISRYSFEKIVTNLSLNISIYKWILFLNKLLQQISFVVVTIICESITESLMPLWMIVVFTNDEYNDIKSCWLKEFSIYNKWIKWTVVVDWKKLQRTLLERRVCTEDGKVMKSCSMFPQCCLSSLVKNNRFKLEFSYLTDTILFDSLWLFNFYCWSLIHSRIS